jgi:fructose-1,6-bisphosphatase II
MTPFGNRQDSLESDILHSVEKASLAAWGWFGKGEKNLADLAAVRAIRDSFRNISCKGLVRIGEGRKDNAPGIFEGDRLGNWHPNSLPAAIALDPIDGTTLTAKGLPGAISVIATTICERPEDDPASLFPSVPSHYMEKLAVGPDVADGKDSITLDAPLESNLRLISERRRKRVSDLVAVVLDRLRHDSIVAQLRLAGCRVRLIGDGDVAAAIAPCLADSGVDLYIGIGGSPEAVISAAAVKCLGGEQLCRRWVKDDTERAQIMSEENCSDRDFSKVWNVSEMARGNDIIFAASGISDSPMLKGIRVIGDQVVTQSILLTSRSKMMRIVDSFHPPESCTSLPAHPQFALSC